MKTTKHFAITIIHGVCIERFLFETLDEAVGMCERTFDGNGRLGVVWCGIDSDLLKQTGCVNVDFNTKVKLSRV